MVVMQVWAVPIAIDFAIANNLDFAIAISNEPRLFLMHAVYIFFVLVRFRNIVTCPPFSAVAVGRFFRNTLSSQYI